MNSVKNHWGGKVEHSTPDIEIKAGDVFLHGGKEWSVIQEITKEEAMQIKKNVEDKRPSVCSPRAVNQIDLKI